MNHKKNAVEVFMTEIDGLTQVMDNMGPEIEQVVDLFLTAKQVVVTGMGKSGIIGSKIAATLASTGTPSFFMHPGEAFHGDLGMVKPDALILAISNSGETDEVIKLLPFFAGNGNTVVAMTGKPESTLANFCHYHLNIGVDKEACTLQMAPTSSTTATLVMGDALAIATMQARGFTEVDFARFHPGGSLGRKLLTTVRENTINIDLPFASVADSMKDIIGLLNGDGDRTKYGLVLLTRDDEFAGVITDGDVRSGISNFVDCGEGDFLEESAILYMSENPVTIAPDASMARAYELMDEKKITTLVVVEDKRVVGLVRK